MRQKEPNTGVEISTDQTDPLIDFQEDANIGFSAYLERALPPRGFGEFDDGAEAFVQRLFQIQRDVQREVGGALGSPVDLAAGAEMSLAWLVRVATEPAYAITALFSGDRQFFGKTTRGILRGVAVSLAFR